MSKKRKAATDHHSGRPVGSKNADRVFVTAKPPACPKCHSTRREPFRDGPVLERTISGFVDGQPYNRVVWRDTRCTNCGQFIRVVEYLYEPDTDSELPYGAETKASEADSPN